MTLGLVNNQHHSTSGPNYMNIRREAKIFSTHLRCCHLYTAIKCICQSEDYIVARQYTQQCIADD